MTTDKSWTALTGNGSQRWNWEVKSAEKTQQSRPVVGHLSGNKNYLSFILTDSVTSAIKEILFLHWLKKKIGKGTEISSFHLVGWVN